MKTLDQEKFDTLKELADLQTTISTGRADLKKLKEETGDYIKLRSKMVDQNVLKVLEKSRDALEETTKNHDELSLYKKEVEAYANEIKILSIDLTTLFQDFKKEIDEMDVSMKEQKKQVDETLRLIKLETINVREDRKTLSREKVRINADWVLLKDRQLTLKKGFKELKAKQLKTWQK